MTHDTPTDSVQDPAASSVPRETADVGPAPVIRGAFAQRLLDGGEEPDPRFTLANERTFLAWIRTSLALLAGGIAVEAFTDQIFDDLTRKLVGTGLLVIAALIAATAAGRWVRLERAMRHGRPLPVPFLVPLLALGGAAAALVMLVMVWVRQG